jgi:hypothetical protein
MIRTNALNWDIPMFKMDGCEDTYFTYIQYQRFDKISIFENENGGYFKRYNRMRSVMIEVRNCGKSICFF